MRRFVPCAPLALLAGLALGCPGEVGRKAPPEATPAKQPAKAEPKAEVPPTKADDGKPLGRVLADAPLPLGDMLAHEPPKVELHLGDPIAKGGTRESCVRYNPNRTWFKCEHVWQRYADKNGKFEAIQVTYEDGIAASIAIESLPGEGEFDPKQALGIVGLELPSDPRTSEPEAGVTVFDWFNDRARLRFAGREYRVTLSVVDLEWKRAKVEITLNDHLNEDEAKRKIETDAKG